MPQPDQQPALEPACDFTYPPDHVAEVTVTDSDDGVARPVCEKHLTDMIHWRFVNHAEHVTVRLISHD